MIPDSPIPANPVEGNGLIFVSIASYRDPQLVPTVLDLLSKAHEPGLLRFGICWQHAADDPAVPFTNDPRFQVIDVDWRQSRGACWARSEIMKLSRGEQFFLQVDSHCRFIDGWDTRLIRMMMQTGRPKPILSSYANPFIPQDPASDLREILSGLPQLMAIETFAEDGIPQLRPRDIPGLAARTRPMAARFLAAGFLFAPGSFVHEVPYDPELYFFGEEISLTLRAFTSGYDLFHPVENVAWHDYFRSYAIRHWEDHVPASATPLPGTEHDAPSPFHDLDTVSRQKVRRLLCPSSPEPPSSSPEPSSSCPEPFGLGAVRTLQDYESYAGLSFQLRKVQDYTRHALEPPNPPTPPDWPDRIYSWLVRVAADPAALPPAAISASSFWSVAIQDEDDRELRRRDFREAELAIFNGTESQLLLVLDVQSGTVPASWTIQPFSRSSGWGQKIQGALAPSDFAIIND